MAKLKATAARKYASGSERLWSSTSVRDTAEMYRRLIVVQDGLHVAALADAANRRRMAQGWPRANQNLWTRFSISSRQCVTTLTIV